MYHYTNNSISSFNKNGSYHSLPDTYYPSSQQQQNYGWYPQHTMTSAAAASAPVLPPPTSSITPPPPSTTTVGIPHLADAPPSPPHPTNTNTSSRPKITTSLWEDEGTICYQVDSRGICVARRQDNDMINGTKLLNVTGMSRGKRDGILKNEKGRVVVKVGAMHLKGVW
ncbi:transcription regulator HTH, apses-type DNA-binding domain-containing protein [Chlamydoabsidia padenii]|nr:transcription regulator HTH, apses-type DNA-binding domain-containing protein [Chlamydoabsidia padenii]